VALLDIFLEIFGYIGSGLILLSMMMTSVEKLRWFNISGSVISMIYGAIMGTWPVVFLNVGTISINIVQIIRLHRQKEQKEETL
jgi:hypothetical protein